MSQDGRDERRGLRAEVRTFAHGRANRTPFVAFFGVNLVLLVPAALLSFVALLAWWLLV
jgi:hypothetical protein